MHSLIQTESKGPKTPTQDERSYGAQAPTDGVNTKPGPRPPINPSSAERSGVSAMCWHLGDEAGTVAFMVFTAKGKLQPVGKQQVLEAGGAGEALGAPCLPLWT